MQYVIIRTLSIVIFCSWANFASATGTTLAVGEFSEESLDKWKHHSFGEDTDYSIKQLDGVMALHAKSHGSASALFRSVKVDLEKTPILEWSWRVEKPVRGLDEKSKDGDDYAARVYVVHKKGFFDRGVAVNYIWSGSHVSGMHWPNAFAKKSSHMLALQDQNTRLNQWHHERRNVREDFESLLGRDVKTVQVVVLMTDTDNSGLDAEAYYGDLRFTSP